ncbi:hypothetical protein AgCh_030929 [Apium graveolens]
MLHQAKGVGSALSTTEELKFVKEVAEATGVILDPVYSLKDRFGDQNRDARQVAMKALMYTQMAEGKPIRDHVLKMMSHLNEIEILGAELDGKTQIDIILMSLSKSFDSFT